MTHHIILRVISILLFPFLLTFAIEIQMNGESTPGGGFQAGAILATAVILLAQIFGLKKAKQWLPLDMIKAFTCIGILIYAGTGFAGIAMKSAFLDYHLFSSTSTQSGQQLGIFLVELGVGLSVFSVIVLFYYLFAGRKA
ncbi:MAG: Na(+)/H(+) antiporter subunit B [Alphaproteobacteria bacterium]|nr:Na(+)/H(+) antiporter subunit B [Alphaproteobacteria bacterium]